MSDRDEPLINAALGSGPPDAVVAILAAANEQSCVTALLAQGFEAQSIDILKGSEGRDVLDTSASGHGAAGKLKRLTQAVLGGSRNETTLYDSALAEGQIVVAVGVLNDEQAASAAEVLSQHGGDRLNRFNSRGGMEQL